MHTFHAGRRGLLVGAVAVLIGRASPAAAANDQAVIAPIQTLTDGLLQAMKAGPGVPFTQRYNMLAPVIEQTFDLPAVLEDSIGSTWATLPANQQSMLMEAFRRYTIATYVENFDNFNGQRFDILPETRAVGSEQVVQTKVVPRQGESHELDYVMRQTGSGWRAVDVLADGSISRVAVQRSDFRRLLARGGAQALADSLRSKSANLSDGTS